MVLKVETDSESVIRTEGANVPAHWLELADSVAGHVRGIVLACLMFGAREAQQIDTALWETLERRH